MLSRRRTAVRLTAAGAALLAAVPLEVFAQIGEIVVTTRRREEALQDVPIAVSPITPEQITRQGISDLSDIAQMSPSFQFDTAFGPHDARITVRGLSNTRGRSNVAFLVDGIDVTTENLISAGSGLLANRRLLTDVERIELIKGPQSALYGRAAFAGAISYVTKEPGDEFEGRIGADVGDYGRRTVEAAVSGPVFGDTFGLRASGVYWTEDGYYKNSVSGSDVGGGEGYGVALTGVWRPLDSMKWKARIEFSDEDHDPAATVRIFGERFLPYGGEVNTPNPLDCAAQRASINAERVQQGLPELPANRISCFLGRITESPGPGFVGLFNHSVEMGQPDLLPFKLPSTYGSARGKQVRLSENPFTGSDYPGDDIQVARGTLVGTWELDFGTFSSYTGYTDADFKQFYDQDYQARGRPDTLLAEMISDMDSTTRQFSQELRFQTNFDGPVQLTGGILYWEEERDLLDRNLIIACMPVELDFSTPPPRGTRPADPGLCDGTAGTVSSWQEYLFQLGPSAATLAARPDLADYNGAHWAADTDHWSYYGMLEWSITDTVKLTIEDRYVVEDFFLKKPNQSNCTTLGARTLAFELPMFREGAPEAGPDFDALCEAQFTMLAGYDPNDQFRDWQYNFGSQSSRFHTPKATLDWKVTDDDLVYFSWAKAQKPGGISVLSAGGDPVSVEDDRFLPEKMTAWELGAKTTWDTAGPLQVNTAFFFEDYTDKQVTTQVIINEQTSPRVVNASAAEVWGAEIDVTWLPDFMDGLLLNAAYTWLDAEYKDFVQQTRSIHRTVATGQCEAVPVTDRILGATPDQDQYNITAYCRIDLSGHKLERTPEHALRLLAQVQRPFFDSRFDWLAELAANYQDDRFIDDDNFTKFEEYWLVDARLGLTSESTELLLYAENLFDDDTMKSGGSGPDFGEQVSVLGFSAGLGVTHFFGTLPQPRVIGMRLNYRF